MTGLRIAVDGRSLVGGPARGIAHYLGALLRAWPAVAPEDELRVVLPRGGPVHARDAFTGGRPDGRAGVWPVPAAFPGRVLFSAAAATGRPTLERLAGGCDVAWLAAPAPVAVGDVPYVLTVHDRSWEARPQDFTRYERAWHAAARPRRLARGAARVLTTTRWGAEDVAAAWRLDPTRVQAVHLAAAVRPPSVARHEGGHLLFVGALEPRKGPDVLEAALRLARGRGLQTTLVVVGAGRLDGLLRVPGVRDAGHVDDPGLGALYAGAAALVVPSRLEGFGLPGLEALAHRTPVISSDLPPVREVLGDAATFFPAEDPEALAAALLAVDGNRATRRPPLAGRTWEDVARETRTALAEAAA